MSGTLMDITARKLAEERLTVSEQRFRDMVDAAGEYVWESDPQFRLTYVSDRIESMLGYKPQEVLGRPPSEFLAPGETSHSQSWYKAHAGPDGTFRGLEQCVISKSGRQVWQRITGIPVRDARGELTGYRGTALDITEAKEARQRLEYLATRDSLTGLPNRALLADLTVQAIANAERNGEQVALLFVDLDNFKTVNDTLGHHTGDLLLKQVALRLTDTVRRADTVARLGGDDFVILLTSLKDVGAVAGLAAKVCTELARPFEGSGEGQTMQSSGSVGVSLFPGDGADFPELLKKADAAMYRAKARGRNTYEFFNPPAIAA
jgi:diguanylate cyclase (GGDEF)-like protein/PAS domain S-box-containing protein